MEHLLYVLWHDEVRPWLKRKIEWAGYILAGLVVVATIFMGWIIFTIYVERLIERLYA